MSDLWIDGPDDIASAETLDEYQSSKDGFVGCPVWWLQHVMSVVNTKEQLVVAIYLWRRRVVCGNHKTFDVPNGELKIWGISRHIKYRTLDMLAAAGVIKINQARKSKWKGKSATSITILADKPRSKKQ
jgi:hypothetical protein